MAADDHATLFSCAGKVAVVAGSSGLIGRAVCEALASAGADVWQADVSAAGGAARALQMDVTDEASVRAALDAVKGATGRLDIVVNCAYPRTADWTSDVTKVPIASWCKNLDSQLGGTFALYRAASERMGAGGSVIGLSSIYGIVGPSWEVYDGTPRTMPSAYSAIKGGVLGLTRFMATCFGPAGIRFNAVSPGGVFDNQEPSFVKRYESLTPLGRMATPQDVAAAVVFLASDASAYITGHNLVVDGGWTAR